MKSEYGRGEAMAVIDAHQHFWQLDLPFDTAWLREPQHKRICRDYLPDHLKAHLDRCHIDKSIFVQTQHDLNENRWALTLAEHYPFIAGVVGWVDLASPACEDQLLEFRSHPRFVGIRHITQGEPDPDFIIRPDVLRGLKVLEKYQVPFDLLFYVKHLKHAATVAKAVPNLPLVIDHLAKPEIKTGAIENWSINLTAAAACDNVYCKLSGMITEADWKNWKPSHLQPYVDTALELFGPERCMYGSDWPVCELAGSYEQVHGVLKTCVASLSSSEQAQIFGKTAERFYKLDIS